MNALRWNRWGCPLGVVILAILSNGIILWGPPRLLVFAAGFVLACLLPGTLLSRVVLPGDALDRIEKIALTMGMGFAALILGTLGIHYLPGPLTAPLILVLYDVLILLLLIALFLRKRRQVGQDGILSYDIPRPEPQTRLLPLVALLLVAAFLRLTNLGYSEFQGDEARAMLMAAGALRGQDDILFLHKKGPVEVLLPATFYALQGTADEFTARLPFALASLAGVLSVYILARRLFPHHTLAAPVAAGLLAVDGYLVAFGRIVQYQSVVFLMMTLAAWCFTLWYRDPDPVLAILAAFFVAVGTLAHYEAVLVIPFMAWLFWARGRREGWPLGRWARQALGPVLIFALIAGAFYIPFIRHPHFTQTAQYITERRIGEELLYNNLTRFFHLATFYNSTYYIVFLILGLLALVVGQLRVSLRPTSLAVAIQAVLAVGLLGVVLFPQALVIQGLNLAFLPFAATLAALIAAPRVTTELKATVLWFGVPFLIASFLILKPNTHFYTMFPAWAILVGVAISYLIAALDGRIGRAALILGGIVLLALFGYYVYIVFVRHTPDYRRGYPATRPAFYPVVYGDQVPKGGVFGFPHRGGWKAIGALYAQGVLQGSYSANEEPLITSWYTRRAAWCRDAADVYFITSVIHDIENIPVDRIRAENHLMGRVWSDGRPVMEIYSRQPMAAPVDYDLAELQGVFDAATQPDLSLWALEQPVPQVRVDALLGEGARLLGFDAPRQVAAGGALPLVLYWEPLAPFDRHYNVFAHIEVEGENLWGQSDGTPACGRQPTTGWQPGQVVVDSHSLPVDSATPPGEYPLLVGLYDPMTGERLPVVGRDVNPYGNAALLGTVRVVAPQEVGP
jgi:4-amino-4-deoxy-L-arabinose transferase-like glycosyltransferase